MFFHREKELKVLKEQLSESSKTAVLVYGKRRVGKSFLIAKAAESFQGTVVSHLCAHSSLHGNIDLLSKSICDALDLPFVHFETLMDLFSFVNGLNRPILIILDEYPYMKEAGSKNEVDSYMQAVIDQMGSQVKLILCGSFITVMKELMEEENPLFGRFTAVIHLEEFDYYDAAEFSADAPVQRKIADYAVFGGSPYVLAQLDGKKTIEENILHLLLPSTGILRIYIENVMLKEIQKAYDVRIFQVIGNGKCRYSEINDRLAMKNNGLIDKQLKNLIEMESIRKVFPINRQKDKKKQFYEISDNLMRFYFTYIFGNEAMIYRLGEKTFYDTKIAPSLNEFISRRFENMVLQYFRRLAVNGGLKDVTNYGTYWYDDPVRHRNGEFDCVIQRGNQYDFTECKFWNHPMKQTECRQEEEQLKQIEGIQYSRLGFACSGGFSFKSDQYFLISGEDMYDASLMVKIV
jgi:AAA+ ATPase superfamily predicted ATPase